MDERQWPAEWMRGVLTLCVLAVVAEGETYGYAVTQRLAKAGLGTIKGGTLYPILARLEADGLVSSSWREGEGGPGRKYFTLTPAGAATLAGQSRDWTTFTHRVASVMTAGRTSS